MSTLHDLTKHLLVIKCSFTVILGLATRDRMTLNLDLQQNGIEPDFLQPDPAGDGNSGWNDGDDSDEDEDGYVTEDDGDVETFPEQLIFIT